VTACAVVTKFPTITVDPTADLDALRRRLDGFARLSVVPNVITLDLPDDDFSDLRESPHAVRWLDDEPLPLDEINRQFLKDFEAGTKDTQAKIAARPKRKGKPSSFIRYEWIRTAKRMEKFERPGICERGLRSWLSQSPSLQRFVQILPKKVVCGSDKKAVRTERKKIVALDRRYVTLDKRRLGAIIIDLDRCFGSEWALREELLKLLPKSMLPNLAVGLRLSDCTFTHPHLIWLLPPDCEVWTEEALHYSKKALELWHSMHRRLVNALLPLGADPGQLANPYKCKNPLSPEWDTVILTEKWNSLREMAAELKKDVSEGQIRREKAKLAGLLNNDESCSYWHNVWQIIKMVMTGAHKRKDPDYLAAVADYATRYRWLRRCVEDVAIDLLGVPSEQELDIIRVRCELAARTWNPNYVDCDRGRDAEVIAAKSAGGKLSDTECRQIARKVTGDASVTPQSSRLSPRRSSRLFLTYLRRAGGSRLWPPELQDWLDDQRSTNNWDEAVLCAKRKSGTVHRYIAPLGTHCPGQSSNVIDLRRGSLVLPIFDLSDIRVEPSDSGGSVAQTAAPFKPRSKPLSREFPGPSIILLDLPSCNDSDVASCRPSTETPDNGTAIHHRSDIEGPSCPPSADRTSSIGHPVDQGGDDQGVQSELRQQSSIVRNSNTSRAGRSGASGSHRTDNRESQSGDDYPSSSLGNPALGGRRERSAVIQQRRHQASDRKHRGEHAAGESLTHAGAQLILFVADARPSTPRPSRTAAGERAASLPERAQHFVPEVPRTRC
jgi:hypothetical protein